MPGKNAGHYLIKERGFNTWLKCYTKAKPKKVFATADPNEVVIYYKDDATALNGAKKGTMLIRAL